MRKLKVTERLNDEFLGLFINYVKHISKFLYCTGAWHNHEDDTRLARLTEEAGTNIVTETSVKNLLYSRVNGEELNLDEFTKKQV